MKSNRLLVLMPIFVAGAMAIGVYLGKNMGGQSQAALFSKKEFYSKRQVATNYKLYQ